MSQIFILADFAGDKCTKTTAELATAGARGGSVTAIVLAAPGAGAALAAAVKQGPIANVLVIESADFATHGVAAAADAIAQIIAQKSPSALLVASHAFGKEVAGRVAVATDSGIITDAVDVSADLTATQLVFGGSTTVHSKVSKGVSVITVRPNSVEADLADSTPAVENLSITISDSAKLATTTSSTPPVKGGRPELTEAQIVVSGGCCINQQGVDADTWIVLWGIQLKRGGDCIEGLSDISIAVYARGLYRVDFRGEYLGKGVQARLSGLQRLLPERNQT